MQMRPIAIATALSVLLLSGCGGAGSGGTSADLTLAELCALNPTSAECPDPCEVDTSSAECQAILCALNPGALGCPGADGETKVLRVLGSKSIDVEQGSLMKTTFVADGGSESYKLSVTGLAEMTGAVKYISAYGDELTISWVPASEHAGKSFPVTVEVKDAATGDVATISSTVNVKASISIGGGGFIGGSYIGGGIGTGFGGIGWTPTQEEEEVTVVKQIKVTMEGEDLGDVNIKYCQNKAMDKCAAAKPLVGCKSCSKVTHTFDKEAQGVEGSVFEEKFLNYYELSVGSGTARIVSFKVELDTVRKKGDAVVAGSEKTKIKYWNPCLLKNVPAGKKLSFAPRDTAFCAMTFTGEEGGPSPDTELYAVFGPNDSFPSDVLGDSSLVGGEFNTFFTAFFDKFDADDPYVSIRLMADANGFSEDSPYAPYAMHSFGEYFYDYDPYCTYSDGSYLSENYCSDGSIVGGGDRFATIGLRYGDENTGWNLDWFKAVVFRPAGLVSYNSVGDVVALKHVFGNTKDMSKAVNTRDRINTGPKIGLKMGLTKWVGTDKKPNDKFYKEFRDIGWCNEINCNWIME